MKKVIARSRAAKGNPTTEEDLLLPAYKIYEGNHNLMDDSVVEPHCLAQFLTEEFATHKNFDMSLVPDEWKQQRLRSPVGHKIWSRYIEGKGWEKLREQEQELADLGVLDDSVTDIGNNTDYLNKWNNKEK